MRAAVLRAYHSPLELTEVPAPELRRPDEVLVRIGGAGVCATDLHAAGRIALRVETHPLDAVNEVLQRLRDGAVLGRAVLVP